MALTQSAHSSGAITVTIDASGAHALGGDLVDALRTSVDRLSNDETVHCVVFRSAALDHFLGPVAPGPDGPAPPSGNALRELTRGLAGSAFVSIAEVAGRARGPGLAFALACDLRVAGFSARFAATEIGYGTIPSDGTVERLTRIIGGPRALQMLLAAEDVAGALAEEWGLVNESVADAELAERARSLADRIAGFDPSVVRAVK